MKKIVPPLLCFILLACARVQPTETPPPLPDPFSAPWEDRSVFQSGLIESQQSVLEGLEGSSVYHIEFNIAEDLYHLSGREEVQYTNMETVSLDQIQFRLFPNLLGGEMEVSNLQVDGQPVTPSLELNDSLLLVPLASSLAPGDHVIVSMDFDVTVPRDVELNYGLLSYSEDVLALAHAYPMIAVYDDEGWNAELPARYGDITYADMSFYIVKVSAPSDVTVVSSGSEVQRSESGETQTLIVANGPARDFYLAASPLYEEISETFEGITLRSYAPENLQAGSRAALETAINSLELFGEKYSDYPYTELDIAATPTLAGGIEYPGLIVLNWNLYNVGGNDPGTRQTLEAVVAHEVAHQWYYNLVGDDQLDDPWLDEALAQYLTYEYFANQYGPGGEAGFRSYLETSWERVGSADIPIGLPVVEYDEMEYGAVVYGRGPLFFIALRDEIGQQVFDAFLRDYTEQLSWGIATPEFLQSLAEEHCACDLDALFDEWVYP
jgi:hypothetical protein